LLGYITRNPSMLKIENLGRAPRDDVTNFILQTELASSTVILLSIET